MRTVWIALFLLLWSAMALAAGEAASATAAPVEGATAEELALFEEVEEPLAIADPIESVNRGIFWFNDKLYFYLLKPVARGLRVVPEPARVCVANFFHNLATPVRLGNNLLQLRLRDAADEFGRFAFNTTVGIGGLFDPSSLYEEAGVKKEEDFGQTLGHYGIGHGFYLVLPVLGPSSLRDGIGRAADYFLDPLSYLTEGSEYLAAKTVDRENDLSLDKDTYEGIKKDSLDPYLTIRDAYAQRRKAQVEK